MKVLMRSNTKHAFVNCEVSMDTDELNTESVGDRLSLSSWGLPQEVLQKYHDAGITTMFEWQADCLCTGKVLDGENLVYCAPTSAGKTMVAELLMLKRVIETQKKAIMILPFVSVAREKMLYLQHMFSDAGINVDGYIGSQNPAGGFGAVQIAVCTIEKANGLINRLLEEGNVDSLGMVVVDELHMVGDNHRGYLLELMLTKISFIVSKKRMSKEINSSNQIYNNPIQIIGMSATLPNLDLLARWLDAHLYNTDFRPVPLNEMVKVGKELFDNNFKKIKTVLSELKCKDEDDIIQLCLETIFEGCSILIFCPSKAWCEKLGDTIAREFYRLIREPLNGESDVPAMKVNMQALNDVCEQLRRTPIGIDALLGKMVPQGVAFHHAGLTFDERDIVEGAFRQGHIKVLVATSTLSSGVNLPARRVIVRTPTFHGGTLIDALTYKQMIGRAGRKGIDTKGESILVCKANERNKAVLLVNCELPPVKSCLQRNHEVGLTSSMKRAILEVVVSGVATTPVEVKAYAKSTMLAASMVGNEASTNDLNSKGITAIEACIEFLKESEFIILKKVSDLHKDSSQNSTEKYIATQLGAAVLASALSPDEGLLVFKELQKARKCFVLENELHILYLVTPIYMVISHIDWWDYLCMWEKLPADMKRVAELVGVSESFLARAVRGNIRKTTAEQDRIFGIHQRFYTCLVLQDLVNEMPLNLVCQKYKCNRGTLQSLQQSAATFAGMVTVFCHKLGWVNLELLLSQFQSRLTFGVQRELIDLVRITLLNGQRARVMYNGGFQTVASLATADTADVEILLKKSAPFMSKKKGEGESEWEAEERQKSHCIWLTGKKGLTEYEAAVMIVDEAKFWLQRDLLEVGVKWKPEEQQNKPTESRVKVKDTRQSIGFKRRKRKSATPISTKTNNKSVERSSTSEKNADQSKRNLSILSPPLSFLKSRSTCNNSVLREQNNSIQNSSVVKGLSCSSKTQNTKNTKEQTIKGKNKKTVQMDPVCLFNISGELDLTCLGCDSINVSGIGKNRKRMSASPAPQGMHLRKSPRLKIECNKELSSTLGVKKNCVTQEKKAETKSEVIIEQISDASAIVVTGVVAKSLPTCDSAVKESNGNNQKVTAYPSEDDATTNTTNNNVNVKKHNYMDNFTIDTQTMNIMADLSSMAWSPEEKENTNPELMEHNPIKKSPELFSGKCNNVVGKVSPKSKITTTSPLLFSEDIALEVNSPNQKCMNNYMINVDNYASPYINEEKRDRHNLLPASNFDRAGFSESLFDHSNINNESEGDILFSTEQVDHVTNSMLSSHTDKWSLKGTVNLGVNRSSEKEMNTKKEKIDDKQKQHNDAHTTVNEIDSFGASFFEDMSEADFVIPLINNAAKNTRSEIVDDQLTQCNSSRKSKKTMAIQCYNEDNVQLSPNTVAFLNDMIDQSQFNSFDKSCTNTRNSRQTVSTNDRGGTENTSSQVPLKSKGQRKSSNSLNAGKPVKSNIEKVDQSVNRSSINDSSVSDCLPPTPTKPTLEESTKTSTPLRLIGGTGKTPTRTQISKENKTKNCQKNLKTPLRSLSNKRKTIKTSTPYVGENRLIDEDPFSPGLDISLPATNQSFTIIDVCSNADLFKMFMEEWQTQEKFSVSLACESMPMTTDNNLIGAKFNKRKTPAKTNVKKIDGISVSEMDVVIKGLAVSWANRDVYFVAFNEKNTQNDLDSSLAPPNLDPTLKIQDRIQAVRRVLQLSKSCVCAFDIKNHYKIFCQGLDIILSCIVEDPKIADWLLDPGAKEKNLHRMVHNFLPLDVHLLQGIGGGIGTGSIGINTENPGSGRLRACVEAVLVNHLLKYYQEELRSYDLYIVYKDVETCTNIVLAKMELNGMGFSQDECNRQKDIMQNKLVKLEEQAYMLAGHEFSLSSSSDISQVLFIELKLPPNGDPSNPGFAKTLGPSRRPTRGRIKQQYSTSKDILEKLKPIHPIAGVILEWRRVTNTLTKVVFPLQKEKVFSEKLQMCRIHGVSQTHTATGRVTMQEPNFQNIPKDFQLQTTDTTSRNCSNKSSDEISAANISMRHNFVPFSGGVILAADYSQLELRIIAHLSRDKQLIKILNSGVDVFKMIAAKWKNVTAEEISSTQRQQAKHVCYGMIYGIGAKALGEQLGVDENEAAVFIESFKSRFTGLRSFLRDTVKICRENGYVETMLNRRRYLPAIKDTNSHAKAHAERQSVNTTVQGSAADLVKKAMIEIDKQLTVEFPECQKSHLHLNVDNSLQQRRRARCSTTQNIETVPRGAYFILQLHDELIYEVNKVDVEKVKQIVKYNMENATTLTVNLPVKISIGPTWGLLEEVTM